MKFESMQFCFNGSTGAVLIFDNDTSLFIRAGRSGTGIDVNYVITRMIEYFISIQNPAQNIITFFDWANRTGRELDVMVSDILVSKFPELYEEVSKTLILK